MSNPFRGWDEVPTDIEGVNAPPAWEQPSTLQVIGRYVVFAGVLVSLLPICVPYLAVFAYRSWRSK